MATLPITDLLAELEILASQALDFGAQLDHFPARVLDWVNQLRGGAARTTDLYQLTDHDHLGLPRRPRFGKRRVPFYPLQTDLYGRDRRSFTKSAEPHAGIDGCRNSRNLYFSLPHARPVPVKSGINGGPRRSTEVVLNEQCSKPAEAGGRSLRAPVGSPLQTPGGFSEQPICGADARLGFEGVSSGVPIIGWRWR